MKNIIFLLSFSILFQSCYSYKKIDYKQSEIKKSKKIKVIKLDKTNIEGQLVSKNENEILMFSYNNGQILTIPNAEIESVKIRGFSLLKTFGLIPSVLLTGVATLLTLALLAKASQ